MLGKSTVYNNKDNIDIQNKRFETIIDTTSDKADLNDLVGKPTDYLKKVSIHHKYSMVPEKFII